MNRLDKIYSNVCNPAWLASIEKLYNGKHEEEKTVTKNQVRKFLSTNKSYTSHEVTPNRFQRIL